MSNLVKLIDFTVDTEKPFPIPARDLWKGLGSAKDFTSWVKEQIARAQLTESNDYLIVTEKGEKSGRGRPSKGYYLTLNAAEHVALISNTEKGHRYRQALIDIKNRIVGVKPSSQALSFREARSIAEDSMALCELFGLPASRAQVVTQKKVLEVTGIDLSQFLIESPVQDNIVDSDVMLEPTELAKKFNFKSAQAVNKRLFHAGLQVKDSGEWVPATDCKRYAERHQWSKDGKSGYNLKWNVEFVRGFLCS